MSLPRSSSGPEGRDDPHREILDQIGQHVGLTIWTWDATTDQAYSSMTLRGEPLRSGIRLRRVLELVHPQDRKRVKAHVIEAVRSGHPGSFAFRAGANDREMREFKAKHFPVGPNQLRVIVLDITRRLAAEMALRESEDHYRHAVALNAEVPWLADPRGNIIEFGPRWLELVDITTEETLGQGWTDALHPDDVETTLETWNRTLTTGQALDVAFRVRMRAGGYRWMRARAAARRDDEGAIIRWYGTLEDIHDRRMAEAALRESEAFARSILEASTMAIEVLDAEGRLIFMNGPGIKAMEVDDFDAIRGKPFESFWPDEVKPAITHAILVAREGGSVRQTLFGPTAKGTPRWWDFSASPIYDDAGNIARLLTSSRDVTEAKRNEDALAHLAWHDALTGLPNRMHFQQGLEEALQEITQGVAVMSIDLDDFKQVNDTLVHQAGDRLLREAAGRLAACAGEQGLVARLGGDEFALLQRACSREDAAQLARRILAAIASPFVIEGETVHIGASIGIAEAPRDGTTGESLLHSADVALYRVKASKGRNFRFFEPAMDEELRQRRDMKRDLALALHRNELWVVFQPQVDMAQSRLTGFEALLRWTSGTRGAVSPMQFVPLAEESGLIDEIGAFVLERACAEAAQWPSHVSVAVNISATQFRNHAVVGTVSEALRRTGLAPRRLELEITESVLFDESAEAVAALRELHDMGIRVALDDFGTGYSSLSYLRRFPFDKIKIDRSFITDLPAAEDSRAIVSAIIGLGKSLNTRVTAEGVETWEQLLMLRGEGCNEAQGYLFSPPVPTEVARRMAQTGLVAPPQPEMPELRQA